MEKRFIDTPDALREVCAGFAQAEWLTVDTEFIREKTYSPRLCLVQVSDGELSVCIDPITLRDLDPLRDLLYRPEIVKVFHAARQDLEIFLNLWGELPPNLFDTQPAASLLGHPDQIGYANLVSAELGINLEKGHSRTDWARRPLSPAQLDYAHDDVIHLGDVYQRLRARLAQQERLHWLDAELESLLDPDTYRVHPENAWQKVKGRQRLKGVQLAILQDLAAWREQQAVDRDRPRKWILKDEVLLDLCKRQFGSVQELGEVRGLEDGTLRRHGEALLKIVQESRRRPQDSWPVDKRRGKALTTSQEAMADILSAALRLICAEDELNPAAVATRKDLEQLVQDDPGCALLKGWRRQAVGDQLQAVLSNELTLVVENGVPLLR